MSKIKSNDMSKLKYLIIHQHQSVLPKGRSFTANLGTKAAVLPKAGLPPQTQEPS